MTMVYRGRPSASCCACRGRRIKCDRLKPACTQCIRMRIECPGYRNPLDQNFRDESESVVKRAQKSYKASARGVAGSRCGSKQIGVVRLTEDAAFAGTMSEYDYAIPDSTSLLHLSLSIEDIAVCHFMTSYIPSSHFDYLPSMYGQPGIGMVLPATVHAASIATLARKVGRPELMDMARRTYAQALLETNASLANPTTASNDATLISVLMLSLFEAIVWAGARTPDSWTTHMRGALALIKLRGRQQFETNVGRGLFVQVANIICVNSIQQKMRLPQELVELIAIAVQHESQCPKYGLACLTGEVSVLLADVDEGGMTAEEILQATSRLEEQYIMYAKNLLPPWTYREVILATARPEVYGKAVHLYASHRAAQLWNSYRMTRILLNEIIHGYAACLPSPLSSALQTRAVDKIEQMAVDICASIPQFSNPSDFDAYLNAHFPCSQAAPSTQTSTKLSANISAAPLLWPLSAIRGASLASEDVRTYAIERLKYLGRGFNVPQAESATMKSKEFSALQDGLHMFYVS